MIRTVLLLSTLVVGIALFAFVRRPASDASGSIAAPVAVAVSRALTPRVVATGSVRLSPGARVDVGAQASGVVRHLAVRQGSVVHRGDVIAELDDREARLKVEDAESKVTDLSATLAQAQADLGRMRPLAERGYATPRDLLNAETSVTQMKARLASAVTERDLARVQLGYMTIRAPVDGIVASVTTHEGETVASSFAAPTFVTLVDLSRLECVALVDETDVGRIHVGDLAEFTVDAYPGRTFSGNVVRLAPDATVISGVVDYETTIRVDPVPRDSAILRPQMTASVTISGPSRVALTVPTRAVRQAGDGVYVWRRTNGRVSRVAVRTTARQVDVTQITSGLRAGDTVLTGNFPEARQQ
jgi:RND family efflux transporter MFP subunit